jgi:hypothetical protein
MSNLGDAWKSFKDSVGDIVEPGLTPAFEYLSKLLKDMEGSTREMRADLEVSVHNLLETVRGTRAYRAWDVERGDPSRRWLG